LQTDPIGYYGGINLYSYVANNPLNYVDPMGLCGEEFDYMAAFWDAFFANIISDPPTYGISWSVALVSISFSRDGISMGVSLFTPAGVSVDFQSWAPKSDTEISIGYRHLGVGFYPYEEGISPIAVHYGVAAFASPVSYNRTLIESDWSGNVSGVLYDFSNNLRRNNAN